MSYHEQWNVLRARIDGICAAANLHAQFQQAQSSTTYGINKYLAEQCRKILGELRAFRLAYETILPSTAAASLAAFLDSDRARAIDDTSNPDIISREGPVFIAALESELTQLLSNRQEFIRSRAERAFLHLQRTLAVDEDAQSRWRSAFAQGEPQCEALGAVFLLLHGIYAFKVDAAGARTDLVFKEPVEAGLDMRGIEGLVLTEWKVGKPGDGLDRFGEARAQAELYVTSALAGVELAGFRYAVVVSEAQLPRDEVPADIQMGSATYRHINLAITPRTPSKQARLSKT